MALHVMRPVLRIVMVAAQVVEGMAEMVEMVALAHTFLAKLLTMAATVAAVDMLVPGIGEIIGGSQREERLDVLTARMDELGLNQEDYW